MNLQSKFEAFAEVCRHIVAHVYHFTGALLVVGIWGAWAWSRHFDTFSQLLVNTPTTLAEYFYEVLILAAAIKAERTAEAVLTALINHQIEMKAMLQEELRETKEILMSLHRNMMNEE